MSSYRKPTAEEYMRNFHLSIIFWCILYTKKIQRHNGSLDHGKQLFF